MIFQKKIKISVTALFLSAVFFNPLFSETEFSFQKNNLTEIENTRYVAPNPKDSKENQDRAKARNQVFQQFEKEIQNSEIALRRGEMPEPKFYFYRVKKDDVTYGKGFFQLASAFNQNQGTLATLNSLSSPAVYEGQILVLSVLQGIFVAEKPSDALGILIKKELENEIDENNLTVFLDGKKFYFVPMKSFSGTDLSYFHDSGMILPLAKKILTSPFGNRISPITGQWKFHAGIDLASPVGTDVYACKNGTVSETGFNSTYGNFIIIKHAGTKTSTYAHLSKILVQKGDMVSTGQTIGLVGNTGASTGPHLHFEVRENGNPTDPGKLISR